MDAAWKVYVGDRRFDDNQISNLFLKLKYETVGRFTFDFRPIDGDESYMQNGRTLRIFWGDLHKLDGVIQRVDWDSNLQCYHVYGADIRGFLLDRVNTEPSTVSSYTSDVQTSLMYEGCDFPSNIWTGAGDKIGTYTFHYKLGIQNTIRITGATRNIWHNIVERGTVYEHRNGCLYDATKNWEVNKYAGATLRFVSGACKNNVYNVNGNTANRVCIRLPGEPATMYGTGTASYVQVGTLWYFNYAQNGSFENGSYDPWFVTPTSCSGDVSVSGGAVHISKPPGHGEVFLNITRPSTITGPWTLTAKYKHQRSNGYQYTRFYIDFGGKRISYGNDFFKWNASNTNPAWPGFDVATLTGENDVGTSPLCRFSFSDFMGVAGQLDTWLDDIVWTGSVGTTVNPNTGAGKIPVCSRIGDIYEIVTASMTTVAPPSTAPATLEKDNHIIQYNQTDELPDHPTVITVMGAD